MWFEIFTKPKVTD